jgi:hypothetical protein
VAETSNERLDSWKEIAAYLKRDVRTAMRWAKERGLPIHRKLGGRRSGVCAFTAEIDDWLEGCPPGSYVAAAEQPSGVSAPKSEGAASSTGFRPTRSSWWRRLAIGGAIAVLASIAALLVYPQFRPGLPVRADFAGNSIRAWDGSSRLVWQYQFRQPLAAVTPGEPTPAGNVRVCDLFGNGKKEVLAITRFAPNPSVEEFPTEALYCLSQSGKLLWKYEPNFSLTFGNRSYGPPWMLKELTLSDNSGPKTIWLLGVEHVWAKSFMARIDAGGDSTIQFVNSGMLASLSRIVTAQGGYLWVGGFNDEYDSGSLAIMKDDQAFAASPQTPGTRFACQGCPPGQPLAYFVFPHYEIGRLLNPVDYIENIFPEKNSVEVVQSEISNIDTVIYQFSDEIWPVLRRADYSETFWPHHQELEREGKIHHKLARCPDRVHPPPVRVFENGAWNTVRVITDFSKK